YRGALRVLRRDNGIKVYGLAPPFEENVPVSLRADELLRVLVRLYAPLSLPSLRQFANMIAPDSLSETARHRAMARLLKSDWLARSVVDGVEYLWPSADKIAGEAPIQLRLLAPFDPIVGDRRRFE